MAAQLPPHLAPRITAAAVQLVQAARAGLDEQAVTALLNGALVELYREAGQDHGPGLGMAIMRELSLTQARIAARLADGWDAGTAGDPASAYLAELVALTGRGTE
ncbi:hypothetical protein FLW53_28475 [Microbispora sp. SCL1-1]|uniref:hypothetical protein n=1 Tax=unclassified Microbispora TaxID=2614687 RepID=UPI00115718E3|nr:MULTISPECIES: hypothetical protein [unclassified Microbispora]NJP28067.1 hypothetical protein [Microbispora sp. CL1-1]TQS09426.1 hypothetical protein FLW53_28475 [Microbispora sp. SCL1-1]